RVPFTGNASADCSERSSEPATTGVEASHSHSTPTASTARPKRGHMRPSSAPTRIISSAEAGGSRRHSSTLRTIPGVYAPARAARNSAGGAGSRRRPLAAPAPPSRRRLLSRYFLGALASLAFSIWNFTSADSSCLPHLIENLPVVGFFSLVVI